MKRLALNICAYVGQISWLLLKCDITIYDISFGGKEGSSATVHLFKVGDAQRHLIVLTSWVLSKTWISPQPRNLEWKGPSFFLPSLPPFLSFCLFFLYLSQNKRRLLCSVCLMLLIAICLLFFFF